jgi:hypothetical protein
MRPREITIYGDWPRSPDELRGSWAAIRANRGGEDCRGQRPVVAQTNDIAHRDGGVTR